MKRKKKSKLLKKIDDFINYCNIDTVQLNDEQFLKLRNEIYPFFFDKDAIFFEYRNRIIRKLE